MVVGETNSNNSRRNPMRRGGVIQVNQVVCLPGTQNERNRQVAKAQSFLQFLWQYPIFILALGPPIFRLPDTGPGGAATAQAHADIWNFFQVAWIADRCVIGDEPVGWCADCSYSAASASDIDADALPRPGFSGICDIFPGTHRQFEMAIVYVLTLICVIEFIAKVYRRPPGWMQCLFVLRFIYLLLLIVVLLTLLFRPAIVMAVIPGAGVRLLGGRVGESGIVPEAIAIISAYSFLYRIERRPRAALFFLIGAALTAASQMSGRRLCRLWCWR